MKYKINCFIWNVYRSMLRSFRYEWCLMKPDKYFFFLILWLRRATTHQEYLRVLSKEKSWLPRFWDHRPAFPTISATVHSAAFVRPSHGQLSSAASLHQPGFAVPGARTAVTFVYESQWMIERAILVLTSHSTLTLYPSRFVSFMTSRLLTARWLSKSWLTRE